MLSGSLERSVNSGTELCIRNAISYCSIRDRVSGSPICRCWSRFISASESSIRRRIRLGTPSGLFTYRTGSPVDLRETPANLEERKPEVQSLAEMACTLALGWLWEALRTTKVGRSRFMLPSPYASQEPMQGRPATSRPVWMKVMAGSWLMASVCMERMMARSSAMRAV